MEAVNLVEFKNFSPFNLSWGQKKRAALAGLLVLKPQLLILDEPFANLDFKSIYAHLEIFEKLRREQDMTILFTSHNMFFVENWADKILVLHEGRVIYEGDPSEGLNHPTVKTIMGSYDEIKELIQNNKK